MFTASLVRQHEDIIPARPLAKQYLDLKTGERLTPLLLVRLHARRKDCDNVMDVGNISIWNSFHFPIAFISPTKNLHYAVICNGAEEGRLTPGRAQHMGIAIKEHEGLGLC